MPVSRAAAVAAFLSTFLMSAEAAARSPCWSGDERDSAQVRAFQTMLMVGALKCRIRQPAVAKAYNRFVDGQRGRLKRHDKILGKHFQREHGDSARAAFDRYNTVLANQYSDMFDRGSSCGGVVPVANEAADAGGDGLITLARSYTRPPPERRCGFWDGFA